MKKYITVPNETKRTIRKMFNCTREMVWMALNYKSDSILAKRIRKVALDRGGVIYDESKYQIKYTRPMPRRIEIGDIVSTSYGTGPYKVTKVMRGCTCSSYVQYINDDETPSREHMHIVCRSEGDKTDSWLNGYDADLKSVWGDDYLILHDAAPVQSTMF